MKNQVSDRSAALFGLRLTNSKLDYGEYRNEPHGPNFKLAKFEIGGLIIFLVTI